MFAQALALGDELVVIVARDDVIEATKHRKVSQSEGERLAAVQAEKTVTEAVLGSSDPGSYELLRTMVFDVLAVGYDQQPADDEIRELLDAHGKQGVDTLRLRPFQPETYKSSFVRDAT